MPEMIEFLLLFRRTFVTQSWRQHGRIVTLYWNKSVMPWAQSLVRHKQLAHRLCILTRVLAN